MRSLILPFSFWIGAVQLASSPQHPFSLAALATVVSVAVGLSALTVAVYRLGVWRQSMANTEHTIRAEFAVFREMMTRRLERLDARLSSVELWMRRLTRPVAE